MRFLFFAIVLLIIGGCGESSIKIKPSPFHHSNFEKHNNPFILEEDYTGCQEVFYWASDLFYARARVRKEIDLNKRWLVLNSTKPISGFKENGHYVRNNYFDLNQNDRNTCSLIKNKFDGSPDYNISYEFEQFYDYNLIKQAIITNKYFSPSIEKDAALTFNLETVQFDNTGATHYYTELFSVPLRVQCEEKFGFKKTSESFKLLDHKMPNKFCYFKAKSTTLSLGNNETVMLDLVGSYRKHPEHPDKRIEITIENFGFKRK